MFTHTPEHTRTKLPKACVHSFPQRLTIPWGFGEIRFGNHGNGLRRAAGCTDGTAETPVRIHFRYIIVTHCQGFGGAAFKTGSANLAGIGVELRLKTGVKNQTRLGLFEIACYGCAMPAVAVTDKSDIFRSIAAHMYQSGFL